ncbi:family 43 glycosylhydrolase [Niabella terrae]
MKIVVLLMIFVSAIISDFLLPEKLTAPETFLTAKDIGVTTLADSSTIEPVVHGDFADPSVIRVGDNYFATGTSSEWAPHFPLFKSKDMVHWTQQGYILPQTPQWASSSFWAPELLYRNGTYYVYYTARKKSDGISCIGVATARNPEEGFTDRGIIIELGKEAIDAFLAEENGVWYITFKAYGLDNRPIELLGYELSDDGLKTVGEPFMLLRDDEKKGLEGQCIIRRNNYYYLLYSAGGCCGVQCSYHVNVARAETIKGPYTPFPGNPVLAAFDDWKCTGHGTLVSNKEGEDYYLFHAYNKETNVHTGREGMLARVSWSKETGWPSFHPVSGKPATDYSDDFSGSALDAAWQWDFRHAQPQVNFKKGQLHLSGINKTDNATGTAITVRPSHADYEITTAVVNHNSALKGLTLYADAAQAVGVGVKDEQVEVWFVKDNIRRVVKIIRLKKTAPVHLKMVVKDGNKVSFFYCSDPNHWNEIVATDADFGEGFMPPWDRSSRPGLLQQGHEAAVFDYFNIRYF